MCQKYDEMIGRVKVAVEGVYQTGVLYLKPDGQRIIAFDNPLPNHAPIAILRETPAALEALISDVIRRRGDQLHDGHAVQVVA